MDAMLDTNAFDLPCDGETAHLGVPLFTATGARSGPRLVVAGPEALVRQLAELFWETEALKGLRGTLILRPDTQDAAFDLPDAVLELDGCDPVSRAFIRVQGRMAALGMVLGRDAAPRRVA